MSLKIGIIGEPNSGKSYGRRNILAEEAFALIPSTKLTYLKHKDGTPAKPFDITKDGKSLLEAALKSPKYKAKKTPSAAKSAIIEDILSGKLPLPEGATFEGSFVVVDDVSKLRFWMKLVSEKFPKVKSLFLVDFTHYISEVIATPEFKSRTSGGQAFARFWDLAAEALHTFFTKEVDSLRHDLLVITEFHTEFDETTDTNKIFVPAGKMLSEKFKPESYFDIMLHARFVTEEEDPSLKYEDRFKYVTQKVGKYDGRCAGLFVEPELPNDLKPILETVRKAYGI